MSDSNGKGYYILYGYPSELKTDQSYTYQMTTSTDGDMTDVTYSFGWKFTCDGVTTEKVIASGLTSLTYTWAPTSVIFGPLMTKSKSGILKVIVKTSTGQMTYVSRDITLTIADSVRPSISNCVINRTAYAYNDKSISNRTIHNLSLGVSGLYGASQTVIVSIGDAVNTIKVDAQTGNQISTASLELGTFDAGTADSVEKTVNITVTDSRGFTTNGTASVTVYGYTPPTLTASVYRDTNQDAYISFTTSYQGTVAGKANSINTFYARCTTGTAMVQTDLKTSPQKLNGTDALENSYNVFVLLMDDVGGKDIKGFVIPSGTPVMDIGADGKTVSFFGTAPNSADKLSLKIKDIASFGEEIRLGKTDGNQTVIGDSGMAMYNDSDEMLHFGTLYNTTDNTISGHYYTLGTRAQGKERGRYSFTAGYGLIANADYQTAVGEYNTYTDIASLFVVGNGSSDTDRSDIFKVTNGDVSVNGTLWVNGSNGSSNGLALSSSSNGGEIVFSNDDGKDVGYIGVDYNDNITITAVNWNGSSLINSNTYTFAPNGTFSSSEDIKANNNIYCNKFRLNTATGSDANLDCLWLDDSYHALVQRGANSNTAYLGPYASSYNGTDTVTVVRGGTVKIDGDTVNLRSAGRFDIGCYGGLHLNSGSSGTYISGSTVQVNGKSLVVKSNAWTTSDERLKKDFQPIDKWESFFDNVEPCAFKFKDGTSGRYHLGFKAQQVKESLEKSGLTTKDFAGFVTDKYDPDEENTEEIKLYHELGIDPGDDIHGINYTEFIALQHNEIQKLKTKVKNLETEINDIKEMIKSKEA